MKSVLHLFLIAFAAGCLKAPPHRGSQRDVTEAVTNEITFKVARKIQNEKGLKPCGFGGGAVDGVRMLYLGFNDYKTYTLEEGRELLVYCVNEFVDAVNADERIIPYLRIYPFESWNIEVNIFLFKPDGSFRNPGEMCVLSASENTFQYEVENHPRMITIHKETYKQALADIARRKKIISTSEADK